VAKMNAHVLITNPHTYPVCRDRLFWGVGTPDSPATFEEWINPSNSRKPYLKMLVDMLGLSIGDPVFLYERQAGFHGIYKVASPIFFDTASVSNDEGLQVDQKWPLRIRLECLYYFEKHVPEDLLFSTPHYENIFWVWAYRKNQGPRGCNTITPEAAEALTELLVKINGDAADYNKFEPYIPAEQKEVKFLLRISGQRLALEDFLRGYILSCLGSNTLSKIFGPSEDIEWYANNVPYHITQKNIDILVFHKNFKYTTTPLRYKYSVVELKKDKARPKDISQLIQYSQWASGRLANGEPEMIKPILIANDFSRDAINKAKNEDFNTRGINLIQYKVIEDSTIDFEVLDV
jgi:hypothetical protein